MAVIRITDEPTIERAEAQARETMARVAGMDVRGWDSAREKAEELAVLDARLDRFNELRRKA